MKRLLEVLGLAAITTIKTVLGLFTNPNFVLGFVSVGAGMAFVLYGWTNFPFSVGILYFYELCLLTFPIFGLNVGKACSNT